MAFVPDFSRRADLVERMDDFSIADQRLGRALRELRRVNRYLGGSRAVLRELAPVLERRRGGALKLLDVGTGLADIPERIVRAGARCDVDVRVTAIDANPATVAMAREALNRRLNVELRSRIHVRTGDVMSLDNLEDHRFDIVVASLFLHHFYGDDLLRVLSTLDRLASVGMIVNDLHRHAIAYAAIRVIAALLPVSEMFRHDGPASVRRGFTPTELRELGSAAALRHFRIRRHWPYRLTLSTVRP